MLRPTVGPYCKIMRGLISERHSSLYWRNINGNASNTHRIYQICCVTRTLFPKLKEPNLRAFRFPDLNILNENESRRIRELNKEDVLCGIQALPKRWKSCIDNRGDYIEGL